MHSWMMKHMGLTLFVFLFLSFLYRLNRDMEEIFLFLLKEIPYLTG